MAYVIISNTVETLKEPDENRYSIRCIIALKSNQDIKISFAYQYKRGIVPVLADITRVVTAQDAFIRIKLQERINEERELES